MDYSETGLLQQVRCNLCGSDSYQLKYLLKDAYDYRGVDFEHEFYIVKCRQCRLVFVNPRLDVALLRKLYFDGLPRLNGTHRSDAYFNALSKRLVTCEFQIRRINRVVAPGKILDVGCSFGHFLAAAQKHGWEPYGVDIDQGAVNYVKEKLQFDNIFLGTLEEAKFQEGFLDVVTAYQLFEHLTDPMALAREIHRVLKPGGLLVVQVPNIGGLQAKLKKEKWRVLHPVEHIYYFELKTLRLLLENAGFSLVSVPVVSRKGFKRSIIYPAYMWLYNAFLQRLNLCPISVLDIFARKV